MTTESGWLVLRATVTRALSAAWRLSYTSVAAAAVAPRDLSERATSGSQANPVVIGR